MEQGQDAAGLPTLICDRDSGDLELFLSIRGKHFCDSGLQLTECGLNWFDHVTVANDIEQGRSRKDGRMVIQFLESRIANRNVLGRINHQQTICERGEDGADFGGVFCDLTVKLALAREQLLQGKPNPASWCHATKEKC